MKKILVIGAMALILVASIGLVGIARAQTPTPPSQAPFGGWMGGFMRGMMNRLGGYGNMMGRGGMMSGAFGGMHQYMVDALATQLGMKPADLQTQLNSGQTMVQIAKAKGLSDEQIKTAFDKAHDEALKAAVAAGVLTQQQADFMDQHMELMWQNGAPGAGGCGGGGFGGMMNGWRNSNPVN